MRDKFKKAFKSVENTVRKNSNCRSDKGLISCAGCDMLKECHMNGYDEKLANQNRLFDNLSSIIGYSKAWDFYKELRRS